jgi:hypothetical protein
MESYKTLAERVITLHQLYQQGTHPTTAIEIVTEAGWSHLEILETISAMELHLEEVSAFQAEIPDAEIVPPTSFANTVDEDFGQPGD